LDAKFLKEYQGALDAECRSYFYSAVKIKQSEEDDDFRVIQEKI
jgi:hypothetical protein